MHRMRVIGNTPAITAVVVTPVDASCGLTQWFSNDWRRQQVAPLHILIHLNGGAFGGVTNFTNLTAGTYAVSV